MIAVAPTTPNETAFRLTGRDYISYSAVTTYQSCPLRYYFRYVAGLPEETVSSSLIFGSAVHAALQRHFELQQAGDPVPDLYTLLEAYHEVWKQKAIDWPPVQFGKGDDRAGLDALAEKMLLAFQISDHSEAGGNVLGVEEEFRADVVSGAPDLLARIDLLIETPDALVVRDFKTSRSRWSEHQAHDAAGQLLLYAEAVRSIAPDKDVRLEFVVLTKTKDPAVDVHAVSADPLQTNRQKVIVERVWQSIEAGVFYPAPSPMNCGSCPFRKACRAWPG